MSGVRVVTHLGRSWHGHPIEDECPCPQEPCGLIAWHRVVADCPQHGVMGGRTLRQFHSAAECAEQHEASRGGYHHISEDGKRIECTAPDDAYCRQRPACDSETWEREGACHDHDGEHHAAPSKDCWMIEHVNGWDLEDNGPDDGRPGAAVVIVVEYDEVTWDYAEAVTP